MCTVCTSVKQPKTLFKSSDSGFYFFVVTHCNIQVVTKLGMTILKSLYVNPRRNLAKFWRTKAK